MRGDLVRVDDARDGQFPPTGGQSFPDSPQLGGAERCGQGSLHGRSVIVRPSRGQQVFWFEPLGINGGGGRVPRVQGESVFPLPEPDRPKSAASGGRGVVGAQDPDPKRGELRSGQAKVGLMPGLAGKFSASDFPPLIRLLGEVDGELPGPIVTCGPVRLNQPQPVARDRAGRPENERDRKHDVVRRKPRAGSGFAIPVEKIIEDEPRGVWILPGQRQHQIRALGRRVAAGAGQRQDDALHRPKRLEDGRKP